MEEKLLKLKKNIPAEFWLDSDGFFIYSNVCTLHPSDLKLLFDLCLGCDTYTSTSPDRVSPCFRFFNSNF